ncbi:MAG: hypothetical protein QM820_57285 [Minicystis sp.]
MGREFLVWLWFESEIMEGRFDVEGFGACEILLEGQIALTQEKEQSRLKGAAPSTTPEAHEALRQGKLPIQARVRVARGELDFGFIFNAETLGLSAVKIPKVISEEGDEQFYERMYLVEDLEAMLAALYAKFIALRLSTAWDGNVVPAIRAWMRDEAVDVAAYRKVRSMVKAIGNVERPKSTPPPAMEEEAAPVKLRVA